MEGNLRFKIDWASLIAGYRFGGLIFGGPYFRNFKVFRFVVIVIDIQLSLNQMYCYFPVIRLVNFVLVAPVIVGALL